jgi:hypothetical protein
MKRAVLLLCLIVLGPVRLFAQVTNVTNDQAVPIPGVGHDYLGTLEEIVSPSNGSLSLRIPVPTPRGRGPALPFLFSYNSNGILRLYATPYTVGVLSTSDSSFASYNGWSYGLPLLTDKPINIPGVGHPGYCNVDTSFVFTDSNGTRQSFPNLAIANVTACNAVGVMVKTGYSSLGDFYNAWTQNGAQSVQAVPFNVQDKSGTLYHFPYMSGGPGCVGSQCGIPDFIEDRNGNKITFTQGANTFPLTVTDTAGRRLLAISGFRTSGDTVAVSGQSASYIVNWQSISPSGYTYGGTNLNNGVNCNPYNNPTGGVNGQVISNITLPNLKSYQFYYDSATGLLNKIVIQLERMSGMTGPLIRHQISSDGRTAMETRMRAVLNTMLRPSLIGM